MSLLLQVTKMNAEPLSSLIMRLDIRRCGSTHRLHAWDLFPRKEFINYLRSLRPRKERASASEFEKRGASSLKIVFSV